MMLLFYSLIPFLAIFILNIIPLYTINLQRTIVLIFSIIWQFSSIYILWVFNNTGYLLQYILVTDLILFGSKFIVAIDSLAIWLVLLTGFLNFICCLILPVKYGYSIKNIFICILFINLCMGICLIVQDILLFYIIFEISLIPLYLLILLAGSGYRFITAAYKLVFYTLVSSLLMLFSILLIYTEIGSLQYFDILEYNWNIERQLIIFIPLITVFLVKLPIVPLHSWLPLAHVAAPTVGSVLLAGIVLKLGSYGIIKYVMILFYKAWLFYSPLLLLLSILSLIYSSIITLFQLDLKTIVAYSSIAHMATTLMVLATCLGGCISICGLMLISHGLVSPGLFICVGFFYDRFHTKWLNYIVGSGTSLPNLLTVFYIFTLANCGIPLSPNFIAEYLTIVFLYSLNNNIAILIGLCLIVPTVFGFWTYSRLLSGLTRLNYISDLNRMECVVIYSLVLYVFMLGLFPYLILDSLANFDTYVINLL
jgi:proton-translocating NADH-quinone oxidoreductase chain M